MRSGPRIQAAIELLDMVMAGSDAADRVVAAYFRRRRYAGSKDRTAITGLFYAIMRRRAWLEWRLANIGGGIGGDGRSLVVAQFADHGVPDDDLAALFDGSEHAPPTLTFEELAIVQMLRRPPSGTPPPPVAGNYPGWLHGALDRRFGPRLAAEMGALNERAPVDLRVNTLRTDRETILATLASEGIEAVPTRYARAGIRLAGTPRLETHALYRDGLIEIQDEGSQIVAALVASEPGERVVDYCAGGGGKTLALAAAMNNQGIIEACDVGASRLQGLWPRAERAGVGIVAGVDLEDGRSPEPGAARVLVDAPCSGTGTWRRQPVARWFLSQEDLSKYKALQDEVLVKGSQLVRPGGRLVYATCSVLCEENEDRVAAFLAAQADFTARDVRDIWSDVLDGDCPAPGPYLALSPAADETDGFFVAVLERAGG